MASLYYTLHRCPGKNGELRGCKCDPRINREDDRHCLCQQLQSHALQICWNNGLNWDCGSRAVSFLQTLKANEPEVFAFDSGQDGNRMRCRSSRQTATCHCGNGSSNAQVEGEFCHTTSIGIFEGKVTGDGEVYNSDPPGQQSVYIPPGDSKKESYRLLTFIKYPQEVLVNPRHLASAGFLYTGYKDRVKCFSCGACHENWEIGDDVSSPNLHQSDCDFAHGGNSGNVPIGGGGLTMHINEPEILQITAPFTNSDHHQQLFIQACNLTVNPDPTRVEFPQPHNRPSSSTQARIPTRGLCQTDRPKKLDVRKEIDRRKTFSTWSSEMSALALAKSGFFYLGKLDRVQCFSCRGIIRNWRPGDNPDDVHKKHFARCRMARGLQTENVPEVRQGFCNPTGDEYLSDWNETRYPMVPDMKYAETHLRSFGPFWPRSRNRVTPKQCASAGFFYLGNRDAVKCWFCGGVLLDWQLRDDPWIEHAKWFPNCNFLRTSKGNGFVDQAMLASSELLNTERQSAAGSHSQLQNGSSLASRSTPSTRLQVAEEGASAHTSIVESQQEGGACLICACNEADIVFVPCGHLCCCGRCAEGLQRCPACNVQIAKAIPTYLS